MVRVIEVHYSRSEMFGDENNEEAGVTICLEGDDSPTDAMDMARLIVEKTLRRSERERRYQARVTEVEREIAYQRSGLREVAGVLQKPDLAEDTRARLEGKRSEATELLAAHERQLEELLSLGPNGAFEMVNVVIPGPLPFAEESF